MKFIYLFILSLAAVLLATGCTVSNTNTDIRNSGSHATLVWYMPSKDTYMDTRSVNDALNECIHKTYPDISLKLKFINQYEYAQKISVYLMSGEQADIIWTNDKLFPYINYPQDNMRKFLNAPIKIFAPDIYSRLNEDDYKLYRIYDKNYFIPVIEHCDGLIPFIRIPAVLAHYMDTNKLISIVNSNDHASNELFSVLSDYLDRLAENDSLRDGVDFASVSRMFPQIGYESFISTSELIGYKIDDSNHTAVDMLNTESTRISYDTYKTWFSKGYIRDDISITYKQNSSSSYRYSLGGAWGYKKNGRYYMLMDGYADDCIYISVDNKYHPAKLFSDSSLIIPASSKLSEEAVKILDLFYSDPELYNLVTFGINGTHYNIENNRANVYQNNYRCFANIVPGAGDILSALSSDSVITAHMKSYPHSAGMFIPSSSASFRQQLLDYVNEYRLYEYDLILPDNSNSDITALIDIYNTESAVSN